MNISDVAAIVSSIGFPILACIYLAKYFAKMQEQHRTEMKEARQEYAEQIKEIMQQHKAEADTMRDAIDRIADGLQDVREMIRQIITPNSSGLKPPDDSWNE